MKSVLAQGLTVCPNRPNLPSTDPGPHGESDLVDQCRDFHSEWMQRAPDNEAMLALDRRKLFPVAVVVTVHDDIAIMRPSLEGVALVVEHIVSAKGCRYEQGNVTVTIKASVAHASPPTVWEVWCGVQGVACASDPKRG